jgi:hypothetical protein
MSEMLDTPFFERGHEQRQLGGRPELGELLGLTRGQRAVAEEAVRDLAQHVGERRSVAFAIFIVDGEVVGLVAQALGRDAGISVAQVRGNTR